jgi:hypothetical protein
MINKIKNPAFNNSGIDTRRVPTKFLMLGTAFILLKGRNTLKTRNGFKLKSIANISIKLKTIKLR